jgi:hypothetical protein
MRFYLQVVNTNKNLVINFKSKNVSFLRKQIDVHTITLKKQR